MTSRTKKIGLIAISILFGLWIFWQMVRLLAPGSYPFAEVYEINAPEDSIVNAIKRFKLTHPEFVVPPVTMDNVHSYDLTKEEGRDSSSYWYFNYFYYHDKNEILLTWTRARSSLTTDFAFVSINSGLELGNWKDVNDDFGFFENRKVKKECELRILSPIKDLIHKYLTTVAAANSALPASPDGGSTRRAAIAAPARPPARAASAR